MYLTQYKGNIMKCNELWYIRTDVHFIVLSDLKLYEIINFRGSGSEFEGLKQCRMAKNIACAGWCHIPEEYQSGWHILGHSWGMNRKIRWQLKAGSAWKIRKKKKKKEARASKTCAHFTRRRRDPTKHWTFWNSCSMWFSLVFVLMKPPWNYIQFCHHLLVISSCTLLCFLSNAVLTMELILF